MRLSKYPLGIGPSAARRSVSGDVSNRFTPDGPVRNQPTAVEGTKRSADGHYCTQTIRTRLKTELFADVATR